MTKGLTIRHKGRKFTIYILPLFFPVDAKARAPICCRIAVSGYHGCSWCYLYGKSVDGSVRYILNVNAENSVTYPERTHDGYLNDIREARKSERKMYKGVKAKTVLSGIPGLDCIWCFPFEYMHNLPLGDIKQVFLEWYTKVHTDYYLKKKVKLEIDRRLVSIRPISEMYRIPELLQNKSKWKAADWLYWGPFYAIPCLDDILNKECLHNFLLLIKSTYTLLSSEISTDEIKECDDDLIRFNKDCQKLYNERFMTSNIHCTLHAAKSVKMCVPLWANSAFVHESKIAQIKRSVNSPIGVANQIADKISEYSMHVRRLLLQDSQRKEDSATAFCMDMLFKKKEASF